MKSSITLKDYICYNYRTMYDKKIPQNISYLLKNYHADEIDFIQFRNYFGLDEYEFPDILQFLLDGKNAYEISKFGYEYHNSTHHYRDPYRKNLLKNTPRIKGKFNF